MALTRFESLAAGDFDARLTATLSDMRLPASMADRAVDTLSGGQQAKVALAALLLSRFDITLLDEPTNDLDFDGLARLESVVQRGGGMVIVSHDRAFLDGTVTQVLELDEHTRHAQPFGGGWSGYQSRAGAARNHAEEAYAVYQSQRAERVSGPSGAPVGDDRGGP